MFSNGISHEQREVRRKAKAIVERAHTGFCSLPLDRERKEYQDAEKLVENNFPTWEELFHLEILLLRLAVGEGRAVLAHSINEQYLRMDRPPPTDDKPESARAADATSGTPADPSLELLIYRLREVQWDFRKAVELETALEKMRTLIGIVSFALVVLFLVFIGLWNGCHVWTLSAWAMLFGTLGATVSLFRRMSSASDREVDSRFYTPYKNVAMLLGPNADVVFSLVSGPIFALLLVQLFAAGFVKSELFPSLGGNNGSPCDIDPNLAKLAFWCFASGFAEMFVPDVLNRLTSRAQEVIASDQKKRQRRPSKEETT